MPDIGWANVQPAMIHASYSLEETIERMLSLPVEFRLKSPVSLSLLAETTGYLRHMESIGVARLKAAIRGRQGLIDAWLTYSAEKQADWGWFFEGPDCGVYLVGTRKYSIETPRRLTDPEEACACFIIGEFASLLGLSPAGSASRRQMVQPL